MTLKATEGHRNSRYSTGHISFLLVVCSNNVSLTPFTRF